MKMIVTKPLAECSVLITRPKTQATSLAEQLTELGANPIIFPTLEIIAKPFTPMPNNTHFDFAIFISQNAVIYSEFLWPHLQLKTIIAIGSTTAEQLQNQHLPCDIVPSSYNSESLLEHEALQHLKQKRVAIFCGEGGRDMLQTTLQQRGAEVVRFEVYRRQKPQINPPLSQWQKLDFIIVTSGESLQNLYDIMTEHQATQWLLQQQLCVVSQRIQTLAKNLGFKKTALVAHAPKSQAILETLINYQQGIR